MKDFYSESMKRNFSLIYFISRFTTDTDIGNSLLKPPVHGHIKPLRQSLKEIDRVDDLTVTTEKTIKQSRGQPT